MGYLPPNDVGGLDNSSGWEKERIKGRVGRLSKRLINKEIIEEDAG